MYNFGKKKNQKLMAANCDHCSRCNAYYNRACRFHVKYTKIPWRAVNLFNSGGYAP